MTFDNEFLMVHRVYQPDGLKCSKVVLEKDLEKLVSSYWAVRVLQYAFNMRMDAGSVYCRKYGKIEIYRK